MKSDICGTSGAWKSAGRLAAVGAVGLVVSGCQFSSAPPTMVWGTVRYKGEPVHGGVIVLAPEDGTVDSWGMSRIDSDGSYTIEPAHSERPMPVGRYGVSFRGLPPSPTHDPHQEGDDPAGEHKAPTAPGGIPAKYQDPENPVFSIQVGRSPVQVDITLRD
jgi:hypothetical protein